MSYNKFAIKKNSQSILLRIIQFSIQHVRINGTTKKNVQYELTLMAKQSMGMMKNEYHDRRRETKFVSWFWTRGGVGNRAG